MQRFSGFFHPIIETKSINLKTKINMKNLKFLALILCLAGSLFSCDKKDDNDMSKIDFNNIEDLYAQPLSVIQKCVEGKWKLQYFAGGLCYQKIIDSNGSYMYLTQDTIIKGSNTNEVTTNSPIIWEKMDDILGGGVSAYVLTYNRDTLINEQDGVVIGEIPVFDSLIPYQIKNDTLVIGDGCCDGYTYYYTKISN